MILISPSNFAVMLNSEKKMFHDLLLVSTATVSSIKDGFLSGSQNEDNEKHERAPSWKVRLAENTKNKVRRNYIR